MVPLPASGTFLLVASARTAERWTAGSILMTLALGAGLAALATFLVRRSR